MSGQNISFDVNKKTIVISFLTQFFQYGLALLVLPVVLSQLEAKDVGIWYIFLSISSLAHLLDFGFGPSIQRSVAYVASGVQTLQKDGVASSQSNEINGKLMASLLQTSKLIYKRIAFSIFFLLISIGTLYLKISLKDNFDTSIVVTWFFFAASVTFNFYFSYVLSFLKGMGFIEQYNKNIIISKSAYILVLYLMIIMGMNLVSLVAATFINSLLMIVLGNGYLNMHVENYKVYNNAKNYDNLFSVLWVNAKNSGIVSIGVFLLSQAGVFLSGLFLNIEEVAQLGLILQLYGILVVMSRVYFTTNIPRISSLWITGNYGQIRNLFSKCQIIGYVIFFAGLSVIFFAGDYILKNIIHSNVMLPSSIVILAYGLFYLLELTHGNCCSLIATSNNIPFTRASVVSGIISVVMIIVLCKLELGILSFPLALCCGSLPYNSWRWPLYVYKILYSKK